MHSEETEIELSTERTCFLSAGFGGNVCYTFGWCTFLG